MGSATAVRRLRFGWIALSALATTRGLALLVIGAACSGPAARTPEVPVGGGDWLTFSGTWSASGTRTTVDLEGDHWASILELNGSLLLAGENKPGVGFRAEMVGFTDSLTGLVGRSVWTDERGDKVFSELKGQWVGTGNRITGTFLGGTGRFAGATGDYEFQWRYIITAEDGRVGGRTEGLKGRVRVGAPPASAPSTGGPVS
jgi:hypothetical protein